MGFILLYARSQAHTGQEGQASGPDLSADVGQEEGPLRLLSQGTVLLLP